MYYFVPAWYPENRTWYDNTSQWYRPHLRIDFDDTINQMRMFQHAKMSSTVLVLNYMPNLRYFMHRYDLYELSTFSVFDWIQDTQDVVPKMLDFHQLKWPNDVEFLYSPFLIVAKSKGEKIAHIEFGESGQLIFIDYWKQGMMTHQYVFDDRGFLSSMIYFDKGQPSHQDYFNSLGQWQIREELNDLQRVHVNPDVAGRFAKVLYSSMQELVQEGLERHLVQSFDYEDVLIVAADQRHMDMIEQAKGDKSLILSFFKNRVQLENHQELERLFTLADVLVADKISTTDVLSQLTTLPVEHISPFDSRLSLGKSQRLKELELYFLVDGLLESERNVLIAILFDEMRRNEWIRLNVITYGEGGQAASLKEWLVDYLEQQEEDYFSLDDEQALSLFELQFSEDEPVVPRVRFKNIHSEMDIMAEMETARMVIDLSEEPDLYTQIAAISAGVPQLNRKESEFAEHLKNAYILEDVKDIDQALRYYLDGLANWNKALVYAVQKIADYTSGRLVKRLLSQLEK